MRILIDNSSGENFGDAAMIEGVCRNLAARLSGCELDVVGHALDVSGDPAGLTCRKSPVRMTLRGESLRKTFLWRWYRGLIRWRNRWSLSSLPGSGSLVRLGLADGEPSARVTDLYDGLHLAGGGFLNQEFIGNVVRRKALIDAFSRAGKPITVSGQQLGPIQSRWLWRSIRRLLQQANAVSVRDNADSLEIARRMGLSEVRMSGDDSLPLRPCSPEKARQIVTESGMPGWDFIAASFRVADYAQSSGENIGRATELYRTIQQATSLPILFVPIARAKADSDAATARGILEKGQLQGAVAEGCCCAAEAKGVLGLARLAVGMSWHFCVFSLSQNVPTICISVGDYYVQKGRALARVWQDDGLHAPLGATDCPEVVRRAVARLERPERAKLQDRNTQLLGMQEEYFDRVAEIHSGSINSNSEAIQ